MTHQPQPDREPLLVRLIHWLFRFRYIKFGLVGASGTVVNMAVLYMAQEYLLAPIADPRQRLYGSLALAIAIATVNNFTWNRLWTWADRVQLAHERHLELDRTPWTLLLGQFWRYAAASWLGIALQYGLTLWLAHHLHYLVANVIAIVIASVSNYLANDHWTFGKQKSK